MSLFDPYDLSGLRLANRVVMSPMTRARNPDLVANALTALYYAQRASAGLIITEGTPVSPQAQGYIAVPGIWTDEQAAGWSEVTRAVHAAGGKIAAQLWHVGRVSHASFQPGGGQPVSASDIAMTPSPFNLVFGILPDGTPGRIEATPPRALSTAEVEGLVLDFARAATNAQAAGFDGVEVHGATGYIFEQFLNPNSNRRADRYGGSIEGRARLTLEVVDAIAERIGADKVGVRLSPKSSIFDMPDYDERDETYLYLARELGRRGAAYLDLHDIGSSALVKDFGAPIPEDQLRELKAAFGGPVMMAGGMTKARAASLIERGLIDLAVFGQPYIANPDLVERLKRDLPLAEPDRDTLYGGDAHGYTDYPTAEALSPAS